MKGKKEQTGRQRERERGGGRERERERERRMDERMTWQKMDKKFTLPTYR